jgi:hypothetical protein
MMPTTLRDAYAPGPDVIVRELEGEAVILNLDSGIYFGLNASGTRIWQLVEAHGALERVLAALEREFDAPRPQLEADLLVLVSQLEERGLLQRRHTA